ncbi:MAG: protein jag [SAR202 cluster bacterium]|nr:protein jag [SAR202 cluster bacterium]
MKSIDMTAKTVEEAIEIALKELGADRVEVEIDVISRGKSGILGIGSELASVRVTKVDGTSDVLDSANEVIKNLVSHMDVDVVVNLKEADNEETGGPVFEIEGDDSGLLIGRKGETLRSLQFLTRFIVGRQTGERANISLDVEGYDERRKQSLANLASRVAQRVVKTGRSIELEPMSARERRLVHIALAENSEVYTESSGEGRDRKVVVIPS